MLFLYLFLLLFADYWLLTGSLLATGNWSLATSFHREPSPIGRCTVYDGIRQIQPKEEQMVTRPLRRGMLGLLILAALLIPLGIASAKELVGMDISGPGIDGTLHIDDPEGMSRLNEGNFFEFGARIARLTDQERAALGEGFHITPYLMLEGPEPVPFQNWIYYPDPAGAEGYLYVAGYASPEFEGDLRDVWFRLSPEREDLLLGFLARHDITIENGVASVGGAPAAEDAPASVEQSLPQAESAAPAVEQAAQPAIPAARIGAAALLVIALAALGWRLQVSRSPAAVANK